MLFLPIMADVYDVLPLPVHLGAINDRENNVIKPFVGVYFPAEILDKMGWNAKTRLILSVEKGFLKITKSDDDTEYFIAEPGELVYEPFEDD